MEQPVPKREPTSYGPFQVVRKIGSGGMGTVFEARHEVLGLSVAIKTIGGHVSLTDETQARFLREARAAAKVRHPNVAQIHDIASQDGVPYMVLELLRGQTLAALLEREGRLSVERAADLLVPVIAGVAAAHECAIVHRDLKPHNVFISEERAGPVPRVLDFGISKLIDDAASVLTRSDVLLGTAQYMSPEQARGSKHVDARSDQYSLGAVLYECVTGARAFEADNIYGLVHRIVEGEFEPPSRVCPDITPALESVILRAMSLEPNDRHSTTASFGLALLPFASPKIRLLYADELAQPLAQFGAELAASNAAEASDGASGERSSASAVKARRELALGSTVGEVTPLVQARKSAERPNRNGVLIALAVLGALVAYLVRLQSREWQAKTPPTLVEVVASSVTTNVVPSPPLHPTAAPTSDGASPAIKERGPASSPSADRVERRSAPDHGIAQRAHVKPAARENSTKAAAVAPTSSPEVELAAQPSPEPEPNRATKHGLVQESPF